MEVRYLDLDYRGWDLGYRDQSTRRVITDSAEWEEPTWDAGTFHHADFGVELVIDDGTSWAVTWDVPARTESLVVRPGLAGGAGALWDVTARDPWRRCIRSPITGVELRYHPWGERSGGFWCSRVSLSFGDLRVEVLLGDREPQAGLLVPSADNVAILLDPEELPEWERTDDLV